MFGRNKSDSAQVLSGMKAKHQRYEALVKAFHADIYRYAFWLIKDQSIAEDVVQETFLRAWRSLDALNDEKAAIQAADLILKQGAKEVFYLEGGLSSWIDNNMPLSGGK